MMMSTLFTFVSLVTTGLSLPTVLHESFNGVPPRWQKVEKSVDSNQMISIKVGIKYNKIDVLENELLKRSDPFNKNLYGKWLRKDQVDALIAPNISSVTAVKKWLNTTYIQSVSKGAWLTTTMTVNEWERRIGQPLSTFKHDETGQIILRLASDCYLPSNIAPIVDIVHPSIGRFPQIKKKLIVKDSKPNKPTEDPKPNPIPPQPVKITPTILRQVYQLSDQYGNGNLSNNTQATTNFLGQYVEQSDLSKFFNMFASNVTIQKPHAIHGTNNQNDPGVEAMLDSEYIMSVGQNINTEFYFTSGGQPKDPTDEPWLKWLISLSNETTLPLVFSASYTDFEAHVNAQYSNRVNVELMKVGIRGTSLFMASGDYGIGTTYSTKSGVYHPEFPAESPYVTSVGGTMFGNKKTNISLEEVWNDDIIGSGGGFSNRFARPSWQEASVTTWHNISKQLHKLPVNDSWYNLTGRSYPDVSALATPYQTVCDGFVQVGTGTSASTPTVAAIFAMLNQHRLTASKSSLGYLNPLIHQVLGPLNCFNDITNGFSPGFNVNGHRLPGFNAVQGFDPASGWGSPNFVKLLEEIMKLP
jgi:tripeptidyl-peptidase I